MVNTYFLKENVYEAALNRIRWLFDEFPHVIIPLSGGKDSTVCLNLSLQVAEEKGRLPLDVMFIDQEAEWQSVIDHIREVMADPRINPLWLQVPIRLFNSTSVDEPWLFCWEEGREWVRPKEPNSLHENIYGTDRFGEMFDAFCAQRYPGEPVVLIGGVRAEESPGRLLGLTSKLTYKDATWGRVNNAKVGRYSMYPIYDWSYTDVWKAILEHKWPYCPIYDYMYQRGVPVREMRVSNVHHESAVKTLYYLQEIEGDTWNRITARLSGINTAGQLQQKFMAPKELPWMFKDWYEYRDYLIDHLISDPEHREYFHRTFKNYDERYDKAIHHELLKVQISCVLLNDYHGSKLGIFRSVFGQYSKDVGTRGRGRSE